ncbi:MAG: fibronectin type III domain-containing protein, partial [Methylococcaceae bacterium]
VITLSANTGASTISIVNATTNSSGNASFLVKDSVSEEVTYTAIDTTDNITLHDTVTVIYTAPPAIPGTPVVVPGNHEVNVSWIQNIIKGDPKTYEVTATPGGATCRVSFPGKVFSTASCSVVGLTNGTSYTFRVKATNDWGSALSNSSNAATPQSLFDGSCGTANGVATLTEPTGFLCNTGTSSLVQSDQGKFIWTCAGSGGGSTASCSAKGEETGGKTITLTTPVGNNCAIQKAGPVPAAAGGPGNNWVLPYDLLNYEMVNCSATKVTVVLTFSGVVEGMTYWKYDSGIWNVISTNDITLSGNRATFTIYDNGPYDADPRVGSIIDPSGPGFLPRSTPQVPTPPVTPSAIAGDAKATISWKAPTGGGAPVRYTVTSLPENLTCSVLAPLTSCRVEGLTNEITYTFTVVAENSAGVSRGSSTTNTVRPTYSVSPG